MVQCLFIYFICDATEAVQTRLARELRNDGAKRGETRHRWQKFSPRRVGKFRPSRWSISSCHNVASRQQNIEGEINETKSPILSNKEVSKVSWLPASPGHTSDVGDRGNYFSLEFPRITSDTGRVGKAN